MQRRPAQRVLCVQSNANVLAEFLLFGTGQAHGLHTRGMLGTEWLGGIERHHVRELRLAIGQQEVVGCTCVRCRSETQNRRGQSRGTRSTLQRLQMAKRRRSFAFRRRAFVTTTAFLHLLGARQWLLLVMVRTVGCRTGGRRQTAATTCGQGSTTTTGTHIVLFEEGMTSFVFILQLSNEWTRGHCFGGT